MVCHKTLRISLTKEYGNIYTAEKEEEEEEEEEEEAERRTNHEQLLNFKAKH